MIERTADGRHHIDALAFRLRHIVNAREAA